MTDTGGLTHYIYNNTRGQLRLERGGEIYLHVVDNLSHSVLSFLLYVANISGQLEYISLISYISCTPIIKTP